MNYTNVAKPTGPVYTKTNAVKPSFDDPTVLFDSTTILFDGGATNTYTKISKPVTPTYTKVSKPT